MTKPHPDRIQPAAKRPASPGTDPRSPYPYIHPEPLHPEHLAVDAEDILEFLDHYGDRGPDLKSSSQAP